MKDIRPIQIKCSSENELYPASNILHDSPSNPWKCKNSSDKEAFIELEFDTFVNISKIDIGNSGSAFVEIFVSDVSEIDYQPLLVSTPIMSTGDAIKGERGDKSFCFNESHMIEQTRRQSWKLLRAVCTQPFNKTTLYGLSFIKCYGSTHVTKCPDQRIDVSASKKIDVDRLIHADEDEELHPGSLFSHRNDDTPLVPKERLTHSTNVPRTNQAAPIVDMNKVSQSHRVIAKEDDMSKCTITALTTTEGYEPHIDCIEDNKDSSLSSTSTSTRNAANATNHSQTTPHNIAVIQQPSTSFLDTDNAINDAVSDNAILSGVSFVLSGYQNPLRNILRDNGLALGATYRPSWTRDCTHLICAFPNTPKFREVRGKGVIVSDKWMLDCYEQKKHLPWRDYRLKGALSPSITAGHQGDTSTNKRPIDTGDDTDTPRANKRRKSEYRDVTERDTDDEIEMVITEMNSGAESSLPLLPGIFSDMTFFFYGDFDPDDMKHLSRVLCVFGGTVCQYMCAEVQVVITRSVWNHTFDQALLDHRHLRFVDPAWIRDCDQRRSLSAIAPFEMSAPPIKQARYVGKSKYEMGRLNKHGGQSQPGPSPEIIEKWRREGKDPIAEREIQYKKWEERERQLNDCCHDFCNFGCQRRSPEELIYY